jgi:hypothetical protein
MPANYATLQAAWNAAMASGYLPSGVSGTAITTAMTAQQKLAAIEGWTVAGPVQDVTVAQVVGYLAIAGKLTALQSYAASPPSGAAASGVAAAKDFMTLLALGGSTPIAMSEAQIAAGVETLLAALVADSTNSGIAASDQTALLALAQGAPQRWDRTPVAQGGAGLPGTLCATDLILAGLATTATFPGA